MPLVLSCVRFLLGHFVSFLHVKSPRVASIQVFQGGLDIRELEEDGFIRNVFVVEHEADAPDDGGETDAYGGGEIV